MASSVHKLYGHLKIPLEQISEATNNFAPENLIGRGSFGKVYRGKLWRSEQWIDISARILDRRYGLGDAEFWTEIQRLSSLEHRNIVSIIGFCDKKEVKIIINKHETKGSLESFLSGSTLTWMQRLRICVGVAHVLRYLHNSGVVHHNINTSTILLDDKNHEVKLSGFEFSIQNPLARSDHVHMTEICGIEGYIDPEYEKTGGVTYKSDVFSFGVVLFEVLSGRKACTRKDHRDTFLAQWVKLCFDNNKVDEIVDPELSEVMDPKSLLVFSETAYSCLKEQRADRPSMDEVLNKLEKACDHQLKHESPKAQSTVAVQPTPSNYWKEKHLEHLKIPLRDIVLATENFSSTYYVDSTNVATYYKAKLDYFDGNSFSPIERKNVGELPKRNGTVSIKRMDKGESREFFNEIQMLSICKHHNIVSLLGFCDEHDEQIIVYEYTSKGSLADYLRSTSNSLPWMLRLKICHDVACGLQYLHENTEDKQIIIHCNIAPKNIVFGNNWEAKIGGFGLSMILPLDQKDNTLYLDVVLVSLYADPDYVKTGRLRTDSDTYSFGVVLFEILCGRFATDEIYMKENVGWLGSIARRWVDEGKLKEMVDPKVMEEIDMNIFNQNKGPNPDSLDTFSKVAYRCLAETQVERPSMGAIVKELEKALHFQENHTISLEDIKAATKNFSRANYIGGGGSAMVYKGEVQHPNGSNTIVAKRLKRNPDGQERHQFFTERQILMGYKHENIISLVGYCDQTDEHVIVCEHMSNGSLEKHLQNFGLTWMKRLQICIDVATGLDFLHGGGVTQEVVIHGDIKSSNILLSNDWKAKIADFGLSLISSIDNETDFVVNNRVWGTSGYMDPSYKNSGELTKESDIYSFGVVLFEILSGKFAYKKLNDGISTTLVKHGYEEGKLDEIVFEGIKDQIATVSYTIYCQIAYQCLHEEREKRPTANKVQIQLKKAWEFQEDNRFQISHEQIKLATKDFNAESYIGGGRFGKVYKGEIPNLNQHRYVAVKRFHECSGQEHDCLTELEILFKYRHANVIGLVGYCFEMGEKIIVYDYASGGSLDRYLKDGHLSWVKRLEICIDIASGLDFIHVGDKEQEVVIHKDIKSSNILIGDHWGAKITGFGISFEGAGTDLVDKHVRSTAYYDPRYTESGISTTESDIYSLGVVLFEILSGKLAYDRDNDELLATFIKHSFEEGKLDEIVFEGIKKQITPISLTIFQKIAYQCIHDEQGKRPTARQVAWQLKKALMLQGMQLEHLIKIPLQDILLATENFASKCRFLRGTFYEVYKAELNHFDCSSFSAIERKTHDESHPSRSNIVSIKRFLNSTGHDYQEEIFFADLENLSRCRHHNIVTLLGFCIEGSEMIIVYEYPSEVALDDCLSDLSWEKRLKICLDIAHGLAYIHSSTEEKQAMIHRDISSQNILLTNNREAKITGFQFSKNLPPNQEDDALCLDVTFGNQSYMDPVFDKTCVLSRASDIYSFGVILFEAYSGKPSYDDIFKPENGIAFTARRCFNEGTLEDLLDPKIKEELHLNMSDLYKGLNRDSLDTFSTVAYNCLGETQVERPTIAMVIAELEKALHLHENNKFQISLEDIKLATQDFNAESCIGEGRFGKVYKGEVPNLNHHRYIAVKRLHECSGREHDFLTELGILLKYRHANVIGLVGSCDEMGEKIIVYEYASRGSLDKYLKDGHLSWIKRLEICIDIASGLDFIHGGDEAQEVLIHKDIKSSNILIDGHLGAKISGFGLSSVGARTDLVVNHVRSTLAYCDPRCIESGLSTSESDIYSLGVVLFEILSGKLAYESDNDELLAKFVKHNFEEGKLNENVFQDIKKQITPMSLTIFQTIAYQCLHDEQGNRPTAREVVRQLKIALKFQGMQLEHLIKIPLQDILLATENFASKCRFLLRGTFYEVYKAELNHFDCSSFSAIERKTHDESHPSRSNIVSIKRFLNSTGHDCQEEMFFADLENLSRCRHHNIVTLLGFCIEGSKMIIVYEYPSEVALCDCLSDLSWEKRLKICLDIAHGLAYIHSSTEEKQAMIHRDISSQNILLTNNREAKITGFQFSKILPPNQEDDALHLKSITGTKGYIDPEYETTGRLSRASDIYSFGVVLFEVYSGKLSYDDIFEPENGIAFTARRCFNEGTLEDLLDPKIKEELHLNMSDLYKGLNRDSLDTFSTVAYNCLGETQVERPTIAMVIAELEKALHLHVNDALPGMVFPESC